MSLFQHIRDDDGYPICGNDEGDSEIYGDIEHELPVCEACKGKVPDDFLRPFIEKRIEEKFAGQELLAPCEDFECVHYGMYVNPDHTHTHLGRPRAAGTLPRSHFAGNLPLAPRKRKWWRFLPWT